MRRKICVLVALLTVVGVVGGLMPALEAQAGNTCSPACKPHQFCCIRSSGQAVCVPDACPLACPGPCCLVDCSWTCCH